jgi:hypothetical protein
VRLALEIVGGWCAFDGVVVGLLILRSWWERKWLARHGGRRPGYIEIGPEGRRRLP